MVVILCNKVYYFLLRGVAQPGSALAWGASGRRFKSSRPDHRINELRINTFPVKILGYTLGYT
jgi:hypothetical protein